MTTEERLETLERKRAETRAWLAAARRRNRWLMAVVGLAVIGWIVGDGAPRVVSAEAQAVGSGVKVTRARCQCHRAPIGITSEARKRKLDFFLGELRTPATFVPRPP